jgi:hypothetical protein
MPLSVAETRDLYHDGEDYARDLRSATGGRVVAQRVLKAWTTPKGYFKTWPGWENRGCDLRDNILEKGPLWIVKAQAEQEAKQDEQVAECVVTPSYNADGTEILIDGFLTTPFGTFKFSMSIDEAAGSLLALQAAR